MMWLSGEDAECWGLMKWSAEDTSNDGIACFMAGVSRTTHRPPNESRPKRKRCAVPDERWLLADLCLNGSKGQGFSERTQGLRARCDRPPDAEVCRVDIILWLTLTDPTSWR